jgi:hypothetical protein
MNSPLVKKFFENKLKITCFSVGSFSIFEVTRHFGANSGFLGITFLHPVNTDEDRGFTQHDTLAQ